MRGSPEQVLDGWKYFGYDYSEEEIKEVTRERTLEFLELLEGKPFAEPNPQPMFPQGSGKLRIRALFRRITTKNLVGSWFAANGNLGSTTWNESAIIYISQLRIP